MLSPHTLARLASISAFLNTAPGVRGGQEAEERLTAGTQLPALVPELQEGESRLRVAAAARTRAHELRARLTELWAAADAEDVPAAVAAVNELLAETGPLRLEVSDGSADLAPAQVPADAVERLTAMAALALTEAALEGELTRLRVCAGEDCENTLVDASRNRSKRFCDAANCANRTHVRSYRARLAEAEDTQADVEAAVAAPLPEVAPEADPQDATDLEAVEAAEGVESAVQEPVKKDSTKDKKSKSEKKARRATKKKAEKESEDAAEGKKGKREKSKKSEKHKKKAAKD